MMLVAGGSRNRFVRVGRRRQRSADTGRAVAAEQSRKLANLLVVETKVLDAEEPCTLRGNPLSDRERRQGATGKDEPDVR